MKNLIIVLICIAVYGNVLGQSLTVEYINNWISLCEPELDLSKMEKFYLIEGVPYEAIDIKEKLREYDVGDEYFCLDYLNSDSAGTTFMKPNLIIVSVQNAHKANLKENKKELKAVQNRFKDQYNSPSNQIITTSKDPVLFINGNKIHYSETTKKINELRAKDIQVIVSIKNAPINYYGQNAKNGLVKIWTKSKDDNNNY
ncbi:MAG: hypothetical protein AB8F95_01320 [Bacteroidia bacterium]